MHNNSAQHCIDCTKEKLNWSITSVKNVSTCENAKLTERHCDYSCQCFHSHYLIKINWISQYKKKTHNLTINQHKNPKYSRAHRKTIAFVNRDLSFRFFRRSFRFLVLRIDLSDRTGGHRASTFTLCVCTILLSAITLEATRIRSIVLNHCVTPGRRWRIYGSSVDVNAVESLMERVCGIGISMVWCLFN